MGYCQRGMRHRPPSSADGGVSVAKPSITNTDVQPDPANPHSWFPVIGHPRGESGPGGNRVMTGVIRPEYRGFRPLLAAFVQAELAPAAPPDAEPWTVTAYRNEVLLPAHAGDHLRDVRTLIETAEREQAPSSKTFAGYVRQKSQHACSFRRQRDPVPKGLMDAQFSKTLGEKIKRGQRGTVAQGRCPAGLAYDRRMANQIDPQGRPVRGLREIDDKQAMIVRRGFESSAN